MSLNHENILKCLDFFQDVKKGVHLILTEYLESITLESFLKEYKFDNTKGISIISQIFKAVNYFHSKSIIHRDLNCKNILIHPTSFKIKIIDFGVARYCKDEEEIISPQGNAKYRMPCSLFEGYMNPFLVDLWSSSIVCASVVTKQIITTKKAEKLIISNQKRNILDFKNTSLNFLLKQIIFVLEKAVNKDKFDEELLINRLEEVFKQASI